MAWSSAVLSADEVALAAADKPQLIAQAFPVEPVFAGWNTNGKVSGGDSSATGFPAPRAYDGLIHLPAKPSSAQTVWFYVMQFPSPGIEFDWVGIIGENSTLFNTVTSFNMQIADDGDFTVGSDFVQLISIVTTSNVRIQEEDLRLQSAPGVGPLRFSGVEYLRFGFASSSAAQPELGELILGRRRQLKHKPRTPYDDNTLDGDHANVVTSAGVRHRYTYNDGRRLLRANLNPSDEPYLSDIPDWFRTGQRYGRSPFVWVENPNTAPEAWHFMQMDDPILQYPVEDFVERTFSLNASEQGPERYYLERE